VGQNDLLPEALMSGNGIITIIIAEDEQIVRFGLRLATERFDDLVVVAEVEQGDDAVNKTLELHPDVVLMDLGLPGIDGIDASRQIKNMAPETRILVVTCHDDDENLFAALAAGVDGYCMKDANCEHLAMAIRTVSSGAAWLCPGVARRVLQTCKVEAGKGLRSGGSVCAILSVRELDVLGLIVEGMSNLEIAQRLCLSQETIKTHVRHVMEKLVVSDRTQAAVKALREGLF
jgi:DNA-binding NarL/FixJ family response regulator